MQIPVSFTVVWGWFALKRTQTHVRDYTPTLALSRNYISVNIIVNEEEALQMQIEKIDLILRNNPRLLGVLF